MLTKALLSLSLGAALCMAVAPSAVGATSGANRVLYQANWNNGASGWTQAGGTWTRHGNVMTYGGNDATVLLAPYRTTSKPYVMHAAIRLVRWKNTGISENNGFGLLLRAKGLIDPTESTAGLMAGVGKGFMGCDGAFSQAVVATADLDLQSLKLKNDRFHPGSGWHTYGVVVRGNTVVLSIDGKKHTTVTSSRFAAGRGVGLFSLGSQIEVKNFTVTGA
jgi:hypothetical protein